MSYRSYYGDLEDLGLIEHVQQRSFIPYHRKSTRISVLAIRAYYADHQLALWLQTRRSIILKELDSTVEAGCCFRFEEAHKLRPFCRQRCNAMHCYSQAQGPLQRKYSSQLNTATLLVLNIGPVLPFGHRQR